MENEALIPVFRLMRGGWFQRFRYTCDPARCLVALRWRRAAFLRPCAVALSVVMVTLSTLADEPRCLP
jgi:hypothetical protein